MSNHLHPIECSDEYGLEGLPDAKRLAQWLNNWLRDADSTRCVIEKMPDPNGYYTPFNPDDYTLAPADAGGTE